MESKKLLVMVGALSTALVTAIALFPNGNPINFTKAAGTEKTFVFNSTVANKVQYGGNETGVISNVETGISSPIRTKLYRESGENKEYAGEADGYFFSATYSNKRTFAFEAGLNNLIGFEVQFKYTYDAQHDGNLSHFNYNVTMTFYNKNSVVDTAEYPCGDTVRETVYTHTWSKGLEVSEKIDRVKCSLSNGGGSSKDDWRVLKIIHFKVIWSC